MKWAEVDMGRDRRGPRSMSRDRRESWNRPSIQVCDAPAGVLH